MHFQLDLDNSRQEPEAISATGFSTLLSGLSFSGPAFFHSDNFLDHCFPVLRFPSSAKLKELDVYACESQISARCWCDLPRETFVLLQKR